MSQPGVSISAVIARAAASNNGRLNGLAMTATEKRCADKAVERGLMTRHHATWPGYREVVMYELADKA